MGRVKQEKIWPFSTLILHVKACRPDSSDPHRLTEFVVATVQGGLWMRVEQIDGGDKD